MLRYLSGTKHFGITFCGDAEDDLSTMIIGYTDSGWAGECDQLAAMSSKCVVLLSAGVVNYKLHLYYIQLGPKIWQLQEYQEKQSG